MGSASPGLGCFREETRFDADVMAQLPTVSDVCSRHLVLLMMVASWIVLWMSLVVSLLRGMGERSPWRLQLMGRGDERTQVSKD